MKSIISATFGLAAIISSVAGHGIITSPPSRRAGTAMAAACGQQMFSNQASDTYGNVQGQLQVTNGQSDFQADECNVWLCKGFKLADNTANVQTFTAGQVVPIVVDIRAPHTGSANVSIVKTSSNSVIGAPLKSWSVYASNAVPLPDGDKNFQITIPTTLGSQCATAGDCVIQWFWDARPIDQTYESCIDFTVGSSGATPPVATASPTTSPTPTSAVPVATKSASASASAVASATATPTVGTGTALPQTFTLDTFIAWLQKNAKTSSSKRDARLHPRAF